MGLFVTVEGTRGVSTWFESRPLPVPGTKEQSRSSGVGEEERSSPAFRRDVRGGLWYRKLEKAEVLQRRASGGSGGGQVEWRQSGGAKILEKLLDSFDSFVCMFL